ncbi:MAG: RHS repeat-associated core domain-containing protein, partial [Bacilli bacterium]|nr:RHS repeat-associated core domain-containing protein [Bacilli bacterium]
ISSIAAEINSCQIDRWTYEYAFKKTKITDVQGNYIFYSFDDYGHTVNIIDNDGTVKFYRYLNLFKKYICETEAEERIYTFIDGTPNYYNNHKLIEESTPQHNKFNPITNHGFENSQSLVGWSTGFEPGSSAIICTSSNPVNTGETSAKIQLSSGNGVFLYQEIMLDVGYYTLSANIFHTDYNDEAYIDITGEASNVPIIPIYGKDEWQKTSISFRVETNNTPIIIKLVSHTTYAVYFDDIQINSGYKDNRINYMENPSVESVNLDSSVPGWVFSNMSVQRYLLGDDNDISEEDILGDYAIRIDGSPVQKRYAIGELGRYIRLDNFSLQVGCWAKTEGTRTTNTTNLIYERMFRLRIREASIVDPQMNYVDHYIDFDSSIEGWQYYSKTIQLEIDGTKTIQIFAEYQGLGNVYFDGFHVYESPTITRYIYNEEGNISLILLPNGDTTEYEYDDNDKNKLIKITNIINEVVYENIPVYDERGNIIESINNNIRIAVNSVDEYGNALSIVVGDQYTNYTHTTEYLNTSFGQYKSKDIDEYNNETNYYYNIYSGLLIAIENAKEIDTHYIYDDEGKLINVICLDDYTEYDSQYQDYYSKTSYQYDQNDRLTNIIMKAGYSYQLIYDNLGRISSVKVNDNEIVAYGYEIYQVEIDNQIETFYSDKISSKSYANEDVFVFEYNENDILEAVNFQKLGGAFKTKFSYEYDHMDRVYCLSIYNNDIIVKNEYYGYDGLGRLISIADDCDNSINYQYDENNNLIGLEFNIEDRVHATEYNYNKYLSFDNSNYNTTSNNYDYTNYTTITNDAVVKEYSYEGNALYRLSEVNILLNNTYLIKQNVEYSSKKTRITKISYDINDYEINFDYRYEYDELGNITKLSYYEDDTLSYCHDYVYDELNQLEFEDIYHVSTSYAKMIQYDKHGNIQSIKTIPYQSRQAIQPPSFICDNRGIPAIMIYNAGKTYTDIYTLNIGQTPSLSFHYVDPVEEDLITGAVTSLSGSNLNVNQAGYYYQDYCAHSNSGLNIFFRIVFQVGNPIQPERVYHYDQTWLDKLISYDIIEEGDSLTKQITYDNIGNPICITHFKYNGVIYDNALLDWEGRQLTRIDIIDDEEVITSIHYRYNDQGYRISKSITNYTYAIQEEDVYNSGIIQGTTIVPNTQNVFNNYNEITVYINGFGYHTFTSYGDLYIEDYDYLGDLYIEVYPSGIYIYAPYAVWKVTGFYTATTSSTSTINYTLSNGLVIYETDGTYDIIYTYDYDGTLISFHYDENINDAINGEEYFYIKNLQGDITTIVNSQGIIQVGYRYDGWGNILSIITPSGSSFNPFINPYTYRGYRYDVETSLYYCNSRYYNPEWGRWLNADDVGYLDPSSVNGLNLYAYCNNNPIMYSDPSGCFWDYILDAGCIIAGLIDFIKEPTWGKAGWLVLDIGLAILPFVPAISSARHLNKANNLIDLASTMNKLDNYGDVVVQSAKITDFTDDAWD